MTVGQLGGAGRGGTLAAALPEMEAPTVTERKDQHDKDQHAKAQEDKGKGKEEVFAHVHYPADVTGLPEQEAYVKEQVEGLGFKKYKVVKEEPHPDGGTHIVARIED